MIKVRTLWALALASFVLCALPLPSSAADVPAKVLVVISVKVTGDRQAYLDKLKTFQAISKRLGVPAARVWRATLAGENTDVIYIASEYPSQTAWAEANAKLTTDPEAAKFTRDLDASGMRTVIDRSLMVEATP
jgi:hypothetical protein